MNVYRKDVDDLVRQLAAAGYGNRVADLLGKCPPLWKMSEADKDALLADLRRLRNPLTDEQS